MRSPSPGPTLFPPAGPPTWKAGAEPIPGYRLLGPLGQGGFGHVWKCEAPGGLLKAIKVVGGAGRLKGDGAAAAQELKALQLLKAVRHPFILSLDRVEVDNGALLVVMELADRGLGQVNQEWRRRGQVGIPRARPAPLPRRGGRGPGLDELRARPAAPGRQARQPVPGQRSRQDRRLRPGPQPGAPIRGEARSGAPAVSPRRTPRRKSGAARSAHTATSTAL